VWCYLRCTLTTILLWITCELRRAGCAFSGYFGVTEGVMSFQRFCCLSQLRPMPTQTSDAHTNIHQFNPRTSFPLPPPPSPTPSSLDENYGIHILVDNPYVSRTTRKVWTDQAPPPRVHAALHKIEADRKAGVIGDAAHWSSFASGTCDRDGARLHVIVSLDSHGHCDNELPLEALRPLLKALPHHLHVWLHVIVARNVTAGGSDDASSTPALFDAILADARDAGARHIHLASLVGRRRAMPPGDNYEFFAPYLLALLGNGTQDGSGSATLTEALARWDSYQLDELDPTLLSPEAALQPQDSVFLFSTDPMGMDTLHLCLTDKDVGLRSLHLTCPHVLLSTWLSGWGGSLILRALLRPFQLVPPPSSIRSLLHYARSGAMWYPRNLSLASSLHRSPARGAAIGLTLAHQMRRESLQDSSPSFSRLFLLGARFWPLSRDSNHFTLHHIFGRVAGLRGALQNHDAGKRSRSSSRLTTIIPPLTLAIGFPAVAKWPLGQNWNA